MRMHKPAPEVPMIVLTDDRAVHAYADTLFDAGVPLAVVSSTYSDVVPYMLGNNGHTVALVADVDDPEQLAGAIVTLPNAVSAQSVRSSATPPTFRRPRYPRAA